MSDNRVTAQQKKAVSERANGCCEYLEGRIVNPLGLENDAVS